MSSGEVYEEVPNFVTARKASSSNAYESVGDSENDSHVYSVTSEELDFTAIYLVPVSCKQVNTLANPPGPYKPTYPVSRSTELLAANSEELLKRKTQNSLIKTLKKLHFGGSANKLQDGRTAGSLHSACSSAAMSSGSYDKEHDPNFAKHYDERHTLPKTIVAQKVVTPHGVSNPTYNTAFPSACSTSAPVSLDLKTKAWFHGRIDREEAERRLKPMRENGSFIVREKIAESEYVISVCCDGKFYHSKITKLPSGNYVVGNTTGPKRSFSSVPELINYFRDEAFEVRRSSPKMTSTQNQSVVRLAGFPTRKT